MRANLSAAAAAIGITIVIMALVALVVVAEPKHVGQKLCGPADAQILHDPHVVGFTQDVATGCITSIRTGERKPPETQWTTSLATPCDGQPLAFREFYAARNTAPMLGADGEMTSTVIRRELDAAADFLDYRAAWAEKCR